VKRVTPDALEALAHAEHIKIEIDTEQNIAVAQLGSTVYYARLADPAATK